MYRLALFLSLLTAPLWSQKDSLALEIGNKAPTFSLTLTTGAPKTFAFPYMKRIVLIHFWGNDNPSKISNRQMRSIGERYKNKMYKTADGFEILSVAIKTDKKIWLEILKTDSLSLFTNGLAKDYTDEVCKKYSVTSVPRDVVINENGVVISIDPGMKDLEALLSERKVFQPARKDLTGLLAKSLNRDEVLKSGKLSLFTSYGDSLGVATSSTNGHFGFNNVRLNQDLVLKVNDQSQMDLSDPIALYAPNGNFLMNGMVSGNYCVFQIPYKLAYNLLDANAASTPNEQMNLLANLEFSSTGTFQLSPKDEQDLNVLATILQKNKALTVEFKTHTDSKLSDALAMDVTTRQAQLIKNYFLKKGIAASRVKAIPKGKSSPIKPCTKCTDEENRQNRRVEFLIS